MNDLVIMKDKQAVTSSLQVADTFGKEHRNVLANIGGLLKNKHTQHMFVKGTYVNSQNGQSYPEYYMNRDGFTLLAMGFTGDKALQFKLQYIKAFNEMEQQVKSKQQLPLPKDYPSALRALADSMEENQKLKPAADYTQKILANPGLETISVIAKNFGYSPREFNKLLHGLGIQYKQGKTWLLYAKYQDQGYTHVEPYGYTNSDGIKKVRNTMKWTQKGQRFLYDFLESKGIMPKVEQTA